MSRRPPIDPRELRDPRATRSRDGRDGRSAPRGGRAARQVDHLDRDVRDGRARHTGPAARGSRGHTRAGAATRRATDPRDARDPQGRRPRATTAGAVDPAARPVRTASGARSARVVESRAGRAAPLRRRPDVARVGAATRSARATGTDRQPLQKRPVRVPCAPRHLFRAGQGRRRLVAVLVVTAVLFTVILARVVMLQTTDAGQLREAGREQRTSERVLRANRGVIFDRNGDELALSIPSTTVIANPKLVTDPEGTVRTLAGALGLSVDKQDDLLEAFNAKEKSFVYVARQVTDDQAAAVDLLQLHGVDTIAEDRRTMPAGSVGQSVIGRTNIDGEGIAGIEMQYDLVLTGNDGVVLREHDRDGRSLPGSETTRVAPVPGQDIVLTLDRSVQYTVEQEMVQQVTNIGAKGGTAIVMDSRTGEIYAMVGVVRGDDGVVRVTSGNIAAVEAAEPGSVVKAITVAAALNEGTVTPVQTFEVPWRKKYSDDYLSDAGQHPTYVWPVTDIIANSSNVGTIEVMLTMGETMRDRKERLGAYLRAFGLGERTALDFPGESRGLGVDWTKWEGTEQYTVAYGQGLASTSIQLVSAINVIANGGVYVAPKLVGATIDAEGEITPTPDSGTHRVVRPEVAQQVNLMMRRVVCDGTATRAQVEGFTVAGKTGTGLKVLDNGMYEDENGEGRKYYSSFAGFFPAEDPRVTVLISIDEPPGGQGIHYGGTAAAPVFAEIAPAIVNELNLTPGDEPGGCPATS